MNFHEQARELQKKKGVLIAAHRGTGGGNIICNTIPSYENALRHRADIIEIDAAMSADGVFYCFHDGTEPLVLGGSRNIRTMQSSYIDQLFLRDPSLHFTSERVNKLEDALEYLRGRCLINIDRAWFYWKEIIALIRRTGMEEQIILKSPPRAEDLEYLQTTAPGIAYMPIARKREDAELAARYRINYCMAELIFENIDDPIVDDAFIRQLKDRGVLLWANVITLNEWLILSGGKDDRNAVTGNPDDNWGWCVDKGFDVLQTDWPLLLRNYLDGRGNGL
jgi:glycerophosphoryl diester phosphodiesterase